MGTLEGVPVTGLTVFPGQVHQNLQSDGNFSYYANVLPLSYTQIPDEINVLFCIILVINHQNGIEDCIFVLLGTSPELKITEFLGWKNDEVDAQ